MGLMETRLVRELRARPQLRGPAILAYRAADRLRPAAGNRVVANSMPKAGTHLLSSLFDQLGIRSAARFVQLPPHSLKDPDYVLPELRQQVARLRRGRYMGSHLPMVPEVVDALTAPDLRVVTILRDPRAVAASAITYVMSTPRIPGRDLLVEKYPDERTLAEAMLRGHVSVTTGKDAPDFGTHYTSYAAWLDVPTVHVVRFEDLVGERGGADRETQHAAISGVVEFLGVPDPPGTARRVADAIFSTTATTFRGGQVDAWRERLDPDIAEEIVELCEVPMKRLGYTP